ncbi:MAG: enoyl-CoA hydratase/isomerase family protein [Cryomorphaceae bacterium]|nr:enoyl-CoA hydratase/isomerase family protein [Cryomorphaceae bacterium]
MLSTLEKENHIAVITVNRPDKLNALNSETIESLNAQLREVKDDKDIRAVIITGSGTKAFVAGADIAELANLDVNGGRELAQRGQDLLFSFVEQMPKPVIAAVNGFALGGGLELAMSCHVRIASPNARLGLPEVSLGLIPGYGGTQRLAQLVGKGKAMEIITTAGMMSAEEALKWGLVNHIYDQETLLEEAKKLAGKMIVQSPTAIRHALEAVRAGYEHPQSEGLKKEIAHFGQCFGSEDFKEGTSAFLAKRKPAFKGN